MNKSNLDLCADIIDSSYVQLASNSLNTRENMIK